MRFEGTSAYVATDDLKIAVNAAITLERPLLVKGEPGTGKTVLALEIAKSLGAPLIEWHIKSTTKALQGLYEYDAVSRLRDSQLGDTRVHDIRNYIKRGKLWDGFVSDERPVLLIDEIDKADIEFPNDLLQELDRMEFFVYETGETIKARRRPIVVITSNNEKELPDAFLRRCFFHYIRFPDPETIRPNVEVHFPGVKLAADVYAPARPGRYPVMLQFAPYNLDLHTVGIPKGTNEIGSPPVAADRGYVQAVVTARGIGRSQGVLQPWLCEREIDDHL